jgi:DNA replication protein DnaC
MNDIQPTQIANCDKHGDFEQKIIPGFKAGQVISTSRCPECQRERAEDKVKREDAHAKYERQHLIKRCIQNLENNTPKRFKSCGFENYKPVCKEANAALNACLTYAKQFNNVGANGAGLIFCGKLGTGKTHLALSIAREVARTGKECRYVNLLDLIRHVRSSWGDSGSNEFEILDKISNYDLLVIDEIGVQNGTENEKTILFDIINSRYENMLPTIIISNLSISEISTLISERSVDRITEGGGGTLVFDWGSYRQRAA